MRKHFPATMAGWPLLLLLLAVPTVLLAQAPASHVVKVGEAEISLYGPEGLFQVDGLDSKVDEIFKKMQPEDSLLLAVYAEPVAWKNFKEAVNGVGDPSMLDYYAIIGTPKVTADLTTAPADFEIFKDVLTQVFRQAVLLDRQREYLTYEIPMASGAKMVGSTILLEGKIILLNLYSSSENPYRDEVIGKAVSWRNSYLPQAAEPGPALEPVPPTLTNEDQEPEAVSEPGQ